MKRITLRHKWHQVAFDFYDIRSSLRVFTGLTGFLLSGLATLYGQSDMNADGNTHRVNSTSFQYTEYKIPANTNGYNSLTFWLTGGDGGHRKVKGLCQVKGGSGAYVAVVFSVGNNTPTQLKPGGTIRFIPGDSGESKTGNGIDAGGGGGGTAILYHAPNANITCSQPSLNLSDAGTCWVLLGVAGGGGGAYTSGTCGGQAGKGGNSGTNGTNGYGNGGGNGGTNGNGGNGGTDGDNSGGGGGYLTSGTYTNSDGGRYGGFAGGSGGSGSQKGGYGYGGGGAQPTWIEPGGGGGGGYSGGGGGDTYSGGGGGGSFANAGATYSKKTGGGTTNSPGAGYVDYLFQHGATAPVAICKNITVEVDATGQGVFHAIDLDGGSYDPNGDPITFQMCGLGCVDSIVVSCNDPNGYGSGSYPLVVSDGHEASFCYSNVQVEDNIAPVITCKSSITVTLDATGNGTIVADDLIAGASDNCGIDTKTLSQSTFDCSDIGNNTVTVTVADANDNPASCTATVIVKGYTFSCKPDFNVTVPSGSCEAYVDVSATNFSSGCGYFIKSRVCNSDHTNCTAIDASNKSGNYPPGNYFVQWILYNPGSTLINACFTYFNVLPNTDKPTALCRNVPVQLDATGQATITPAAVDNGSSDACGPVTESLNITSFDCSKVGINTVTLTVTNSMGNTKTCTANVLVQDQVAPHALCKNFTFQLGPTGQGNLATTDINNGSSDACGILSITLSKSSFNCSNVGTNSVLMSVTDVNHNTSTCGATVTVKDQIPPVALCKNKTVSLNATGQGSIVSADINNGSTDACGIANLSLNNSSFNCSNVGLNIVTLTATDLNGNTNTCTATVTVEDHVAPAARCQNATLNLDASGHATLLPSLVNNGSSDACGIQMLAVSPNLFTCNELGPNTVVLTATDVNNNTATCSATVTVKDVTPPVADCKNITVPIDNSGFYMIIPSDVAGVNIFEACGALPNMGIDLNKFTCADLGQRTVKLTLTDNSNNTSSCTSIVTVKDVAPPQMHCKSSPVPVELDANGQGFITFEAVDDWSTDNCSGDRQANLILSMTGGTYTCAEIGMHMVTLTGTDESNNSATCTATISVADHVAPAAHCQDVTVFLDANGNGSTNAAAVNNASSDACGIKSTVLSGTTSFTCANIGPNTVTLTVTDNNGNTASCMATVTVTDAISPTVICKNFTTYLNASGAAAITTTDVFQSAADNCGTVNKVSVSPGIFNCNNIGSNTVTLTVNDGHGNTNTCTASVTVVDTIPPTVVCKPFTASLNTVGIATVATADVLLNSSDNCNIINQVSVLPNTFTCNNFGPNNVTLTINDGHGNTATCSTTVTVDQKTAPKPTVAAIANQVICINGSCMGATLTSPTPGTIFSWTNSTPAIGLPAAGKGNIPSFVTTGTGVGVIIVTPEVNGCTGVPGSFLIVVF